MRHLARHLALAALLLGTGSIAHASPTHKGKVTKRAPKKSAKKSSKHHAKVADVVDDDAPAAEADQADERPDDARVVHEKRTTRHAKPDDDTDDSATRDAGHDDDDSGSTRAKRSRPAHPDFTKHHDGRVDAEDVLSRTEARQGHARQRRETEEAAVSASDEEDARAQSEPRLTGTAHHHPHAHDDDDSKTERVAFADPDQPAHAVDADTIQSDAPVKIHKLAEPQTKDWHVAIGPYLWASSVDANVSLGPTTVSSGVDFVQLEQHARYGMELLSEARYKQFGLYGDLMYGVVAVDGSRSVGPLMVSLDGEASTVMIDGEAGYTFYGDDHSPISLEGRAGVRYQRTGVSATLGLSGATVAPPEQVSAGADALAGGHVVVRPLDWFYFTGTADIGVVGASSRTWSASADANVQIGARLMLTVGYRTLTMDRSQIELVLHGPRAAVQLTF
jgi:hypothetical protein